MSESAYDRDARHHALVTDGDGVRAIPKEKPDPHPRVKAFIERNHEKANAPNPLTEATRKPRVNPLTDSTP